jgi:hypothetical protein
MKIFSFIPLIQEKILTHLGMLGPNRVPLLLRKIADLSWIILQWPLHRHIWNLRLSNVVVTYS